MAKQGPVHGIDPKRRLRPNARRILSVRVGEVYAYDGLVGDPANVTELHDMRIACKRLRYLLEIFDIAFDDDLTPYVEQVKELQDLLGDIHDCDVQVPMLLEHLAWLERREAEAVRELIGTTATARGARERERAYERFRGQLEGRRRGDERIGVHALIARRRREREQLYAQFLDLWRHLKRERFRQRLERALGI